MRQIIVSLLLFLLVVSTITTTITANAKETPDIKLIDISVGDTKEESACIFDVNGKTVVVDRRDKETIDGITIYVQEVYPVNIDTKEGDRCEFMYSISNEGEAAEDEEAIKSERIGETIINFLLGKRDVVEKETDDDVRREESEEEVTKEPEEETRVLINGYDVTEIGTGEIAEEMKEDGTEETASKKEGFFRRIISWIFGT